MTQALRKIGQSFLMGVGTISLLAVVTGIINDIQKADLLAMKAPVARILQPSPFCADTSTLARSLETVFDRSELTQVSCRNQSESHYEKEIDDDVSKNFQAGT